MRLGRDDVITSLLSAGADIEIKGNNNSTLLELAIESRHTQIAALLNCIKGERRCPSPPSLLPLYVVYRLVLILFKPAELLEWLKGLSCPQLLVFFIKHELVGKDLGEISKEETMRLLVEIEAEFKLKPEVMKNLNKAFKKKRGKRLPITNSFAFDVEKANSEPALIKPFVNMNERASKPLMRLRNCKTRTRPHF